MLGPIDYIIVGFEGNKFNGSILKALSEAIDKGIIGLVDLALIIKNEKGEVAAVNVADLGDAVAIDFVEKHKPAKKSIDQSDIDEMAGLLKNNTSAGLLIIEQLWAKPLKKAIIDTNGVLIAEGRIHPEAAEELSKEGK
jgi:hypothetical protein